MRETGYARSVIMASAMKLLAKLYWFCPIYLLLIFYKHDKTLIKFDIGMLLLNLLFKPFDLSS